MIMTWTNERWLQCASAAMLISAAGCQPVEQWQMFDPSAEYARKGTTEPPTVRQMVLDDSDAPSGRNEPAATLKPVDGAIKLTVEDATLLALQNNRDLRVQRFDPAITATFEQIERGVYDPEVFVDLEYFEDEAVEVSRATEENFSVTRQENTATAGLRQRLPTGTDLELSASTNRSTSNRSPEQQETRVGLTVTQALLRGYGPQVNLASVRQAELDTLASLYQLQGFAEVLVADTETRYWRYTLAARRIEIFEQSLELARRQLEETNQRIEIGVRPATERAFAEAEVAQREQDLIDARSELDVLRLQLLRLVNPRSRSSFALQLNASSDPATEPAPLDDVADRVDLAVQRRPELNEARLRLDQQRLQTLVTRNGVLPRLDLFIALGRSGFADTFEGTVRRIDSPAFDLTAGLSFSYPLGNRAAEGRHETSLLSRRQAAEAVHNLEQLVRLDVWLAAAEVERARQQINATAATRALREEALRVEEERFRVGESTSLLVAQAQRDLLESRINEVEAVVAYRVALIELYLAEGTLLSRRGLVLE